MQPDSRAANRVKNLMKIAREAGIFLAGARSLTDCTTPRQRETKLRQILRDAGMHGTTVMTLS